MECNATLADEVERKKNRERRKFLKAIQEDGETLWVYPFADDPHSNAVVRHLRVTRNGHLVGTISTENHGTFDIVLDRIQVHYQSDGEYNPGVSLGNNSKVPEPFTAFRKAWDIYIRDFN